MGSLVIPIEVQDRFLDVPQEEGLVFNIKFTYL